MSAITVSSWRELDEAVADTSWCCHDHRVHSTLVFRGLARSSYRNISSLARLAGDYPALERHLLRNFRKYAHRERPGTTTWDWLGGGPHHTAPPAPPRTACSPPLAPPPAPRALRDCLVERRARRPVGGRHRGRPRAAARGPAGGARERGRTGVHDR